MNKWSIGAAILLLLGGCDKPVQQAETLRPVQVVKVAYGAKASSANYSGEVRARYETALAFRAGGKIMRRYVDVGSVVKAGQLLAELDPQDLKLAESSSSAQLAAAQADYEQAARELKRYAELLDKKFISPTEFERRKNMHDTAQARLAQAKAQLGISANLAGYGQLRADHAGVITALEAEAGQVVAPGQPVMRLARQQEKEVVISVPENRLAELRAAKEISISLWADPAKRLRGKLREISPAADPVTRTYAAKVTLLDAAPEIQLGMTANVLLGGAAMPQAVELPLTALFQQQTNPAVWRVDAGSGKVHLVPVQVGEYRDTTFTVLGGLQPGDLVARAGVQKLVEGQQVRVLQ